MTDDMVEVTWRFRRRTARVVGVGAGVVVLLVAWWVVSAQGSVERGNAGWAPGYRDECEFPDESLWTLFAADDDVVAMTTVENTAPWPVTVVSYQPEVFRFAALPDDPRDDVVLPGAYDGDTTERVTIPAGRQVTMVVTEPFPEAGTMLAGTDKVNDRRGVDGADVQVWSLGLPHDTRVEFGGMIRQSELPTDSAAFQRQLAEMCHDDD